MVKALRGQRFLDWQEEMRRPITVPSRSPDLSTVGRYKCAGCERTFFYKHGDPETPQYARGKKGQWCHRCWHKRGFSSVLYRSGCWLCDIQSALEGRTNGHIRDSKSMEKTTPLVGQQTVAPEPVATKRKRRRNARRAVLSN